MADAKDSKGKAIEIKATGSKGGTTTINMNVVAQLGDQFGGLYWMYFNLDTDEVEICFFPPENIMRIGSAGEGKRTNVTLSKYIDKKCQKKRFRFDKNTSSGKYILLTMA
ncbi:hypothetical protein OFO73_17305 [Escherichia coli]|nr:hypothetical protein [Escherichia coli]